MSDETVSLDDWVAEFSCHLNGIIFNLLKQEERERGVVCADTAATAFLSTFVNRLVHEKLNQKLVGRLTEQQKYEIVSQDYGRLKTDIQDAIAYAFQGAMTKFSGKPQEYYCQIAPLPEMKAKLQC